MTDNEIIKALERCIECNNRQIANCNGCLLEHTYPECDGEIEHLCLDLINRQKAEIERLEEETQNARKKALLEATSKFAGHSDYHGDTILCKLICMAEGKEVGVARPLDISRIKAEAVKEFAERVKKHSSSYTDDDYGFIKMVDNLVKVITEGKKCTQCRYFVGCECFDGKVCDLFEEGKNDE